MHKKKILILGATGMLGHTLMIHLSQNKKIKVFGTVRKFELIKKYKKFNNKLIKLDASNFSNLEKCIKKINPDYVINCVGIIKQKFTSSMKKKIYLINSILPNFLNFLSLKNNFNLIHISTDCVFDGKSGNYDEKKKPNALDVYGLSKFKGEVFSAKTLTLRTSIIGHELGTNLSFMEWFLKSKGSVQGYKKAFFSGLTTLQLSKFIEKILFKKFESGLFNSGGDKISKFDLLLKIKEIYYKDISIYSTNNFKIDRSLNSLKFYNHFNFKKRSWKKMLKELNQFYLKNKHFYENFQK